MDEAVRSLLIAILGMLSSAVISYGWVLKARGDNAKQQIKLDQERQAQQNEHEEQFNASLESFRTLFSEERLLRIKRDVELAKLYTDFRFQEEKVRGLETSHNESVANVERLEAEIVGLKERIAELHVVLAAAEKARDEALQLVESKNKELAEAYDLVRIRNGELKEARDTVVRIEQVLQEQTLEMVNMQERLLTLEGKKVDTSKLDGDKLPDVDPIIR